MAGWGMQTEFSTQLLEDVGAPIEYPFEPLGCPHTTSSCLATVVCCCFATAQHYSGCRCCAETSVSQDEPFATTGYVRHFARLGAQGVFDLDARLLRLFCVSLYPATSWERCSISSAQHRCSSSCCRCSASSRAQARCHQPSANAELGYVGGFSRFLVESVEIERHLLEVEGRGLYADCMALVGPPNPQNQGRGQQEDSGVGSIWMQLCRSFASRQDCACIGVLGIASERSQLYALLVGSQNVDPEDGACADPKSAAAHSTSLSRVSSLSAFALVGRTQTPETRPVVVCSYQATNIDPCGRSARKRHRSRQRARVLPLLGGRLGHKQALFLGQIRGGDQGQSLHHHLFGRVRREVPPAAGIQRDFDASAAPGLYIGMQEGAAQMHIRTVDIVGQMAADGLADLARLQVRHDLVVQLHSDRVPSFACAHPCADMVPNAAGVCQYPGHVCAHDGGQVALLTEAFGSAEVVHERLPVEDPREILCVVDTIEAVAVDLQQAF